MFEELCGKNAFQNVILTTTMWDDVDEEAGKTREEDLQSNYWKSMLDRNSTTSRFTQTRESAYTVIDPLIEAANERSSDLLQKELMDMRRKLPSISDERVRVCEEMKGLVGQRQDLLRRIRNEVKRTDGNKMIEHLEEEHQELLTTLKAMVNEMRRLKLPLGRHLLNMIVTDESFHFWDAAMFKLSKTFF